MLIDVHAHLDQYTENTDTVFDEINKHQIMTVSNSVDLDSYRRNCEIARRSNLVIPAFGVHPINASKYSGNLQQLDEAMESSPLFGEVGLDFKFVEEECQATEQKIVFEYFLTTALKQKKYVIVHSKETEGEVLNLIEKHNVQNVIMHWFTGTWEIFRKWVDRGAFFSIGADILYSTRIQQMARELPLDQLLTETDNPLISLNLPNAIAMPRVLVDITEELARQRGTTMIEVTQAVARNFMAIIQSTPTLRKFSKKIARALKNQRGSG